MKRTRSIRPLTGAWLKLDRAGKHLDELNRETRAFVDPAPYRFITELDPDTGDHIVRLRFAKPGTTVPRRLSVIAGDAVHNLRSALDHLAFELAGVAANEDTEFPVFDDRGRYQRAEERKLRGVSRRDRAIIESLQPYHVREGIYRGRLPGLTEHSALAPNAMLSAVARLDNMDKHRLLLPPVPLLGFRTPEFSGVKRVEGTVMGDWIPMEDGAELFRLTKIELLPGAGEVQMKKAPPFSIAFGDPLFTPEEFWLNRWKGAMTAADLRHAADMFRVIIGRFA